MMPSIWQLVIVLAVVLLLFGGRGKISAIMGDFGKGLRNFKTGLKDSNDEVSDEVPPNVIETDSQPTTQKSPTKKKAGAKKVSDKKSSGKKKAAGKKASATK